jgi:polysaccharide export outer membrane protein
VDVSRFATDTIPVIFSVSFRDPAGYFLATRVQMRNQDVVFAANATAVEVTKFVNFLNVILVTGSNGMSVATQARECCNAGLNTVVTPTR